MVGSEKIKGPEVCPTEKRVIDTVAWVVKEYGIDENRVYLCGNSMGGSGTLGIGMRHGDVFEPRRRTCPPGSNTFLQPDVLRSADGACGHHAPRSSDRGGLLRPELQLAEGPRRIGSSIRSWPGKRLLPVEEREQYGGRGSRRHCSSSSHRTSRCRHHPGRGDRGRESASVAEDTNRTGCDRAVDVRHGQRRSQSRRDGCVTIPRLKVTAEPTTLTVRPAK